MALVDLLLKPLPPTDPFDPLAVHPAALITGAESGYIDEYGHSRLETIHPAALPAVNLKLVRDGYGELILRVKEGGRFRPVTEEEYAKAYQIFRKYAPGIDADAPVVKSRIEMMRKELRQINPNMVGTFIPRTLYDLIFIRKTIEEDIKKRPTARYVLSAGSNSWCTAHPGTQEEHRHETVVIGTLEDTEKNLSKLAKIGHRLNEAASEMLMQLDHQADHLTIEQIRCLVNDQVKFLQNFNRLTSMHFHALGERYFPSDTREPALSSIFSIGSQWDMSLDTEANAQIIRDAADLECQPSSIGKLIVYRGAIFSEDCPEITRGSGKHKVQSAYSISYGSGLFPGAVHDQEACAYFYMKRRPLGYAFVIDPTQENAKYFYAPRLTALETLFGKGEFFHCRYKVSHAEDSFWGHYAGATQTDAFKSPLSRQELMAKFEELKKRNIVIFKYEESFLTQAAKKAKAAFAKLKSLMP